MIELRVYVSREGLLQVSIEDCTETDAGEMATGYRILGPKFDGSSSLRARCILTPSDAEEIRSYLKYVQELSAVPPPEETTS